MDTFTRAESSVPWPARRHARRGFTLIELMVVLAIMVVMSGMVAVSLAPAMADARMRNACSMVISMMGYARSYAAARQTETRVVIAETRDGLEVRVREANEEGDEELAQVLTPSGRYRSLPDGISVESVWKPSAEEEQLFCGFTPLGQTDEATITLVDKEGRRRLIHLDPITGRCKVEIDNEETMAK
ncbi:MAG: prepilin-type N-terminal cleavage/methylation domain-containing protein [Armatimonadota bacterium]